MRNPTHLRPSAILPPAENIETPESSVLVPAHDVGFGSVKTESSVRVQNHDVVFGSQQPTGHNGRSPGHNGESPDHSTTTARNQAEIATAPCEESEPPALVEPETEHEIQRRHRDELNDRVRQEGERLNPGYNDKDPGEMTMEELLQHVKELNQRLHMSHLALRSDMGLAPVTDDGSLQGNTTKHDDALSPPAVPKPQDSSGSVCCFTLPGTIAGMNVQQLSLIHISEPTRPY